MNTADFDPKKMVNTITPNGCRIIDAPVWHEKSGKWRALAEHERSGMLVLIDFAVVVKGQPGENNGYGNDAR